MVTKNVCEDVPIQKNVTAEVETCIQTPKEVNSARERDIFILLSLLFVLGLQNGGP